MNLIEWTYEYFQNRYGLKNVADKKFSQFVGSILRFKDKTPRFRLFGRFLQLYDELSEQDLKLYVDIVHNKFKSVLNFQILESDEVILIPTQRAIDYFKQTFVARLTQSSMSHCLKIVSYTPSLTPLVITMFSLVTIDSTKADRHLEAALRETPASQLVPGGSAAG